MSRIFAPAFVLATLGFALSALPAHAYFDPGSGSMLLQLILGGVAGLVVAIKMYWHKVLGFFGKSGKRGDDQPEV
jgi:hypothetical protein